MTPSISLRSAASLAAGARRAGCWSASICGRPSRFLSVMSSRERGRRDGADRERAQQERAACREASTDEPPSPASVRFVHVDRLGGYVLAAAARSQRPCSASARRRRPRAAQRADERAVVVVVDLAGAVVELELLQRGERVVALLDQQQPLLLGLGRRVETVVVGAGRRRNGSATSRTATPRSARPGRARSCSREREPRDRAAAARARRATARRASRRGRRCRRSRSGSRAASRAP